ncbi:MAG: NADH-quinone oxidoreductase subunit NuoK [Bacteroidetes bacterium]|nr:NADH-quinone oxidoreductase subunit NuoK [Bacteroidota bacterium]
MIGLYHYLMLSLILFCIGLAGLLIRRSVISMLISIEILFNAVNLAAVSFNRFLYPNSVTGQIFVVFIITVAAAEAAVALALVMAVYKNFKTVEVSGLTTLKG